MSGKVGLVPSKPHRIPLNNIKVDLAKLFTKVTEAVFHTTLVIGGKPDALAGLVTSIVGSFEALSFDAPASERAWRLIFNSVARAVTELAVEALHSTQSFDTDVSALFQGADFSISDEEITIDDRFFIDPGRLAFVPKLERAIESWLINVGCSPEEARSKSSMFPAYFIHALNDEWRGHYEDYEPLLKVVSTPFKLVTQKARDWSIYSSWLRKQVAMPLFEEPFGLRDIYIPLRASYKPEEPSPARNASAGQQAPVPQNSPAKNIVLNLEREIESWIEIAGADDPIRIISGGPGSGKSSFVKMLSAKYASSGTIKPLFVALQRFALTSDMCGAIGRYLRETGFFKDNLLLDSSGGVKYLLIFDGLDELTRPGELADRVASEFLQEVERTVRNLNLLETRCLAIITGRTVAVQRSRSAIRLAGRKSLSVLKYYYDGPARERFDDPSNLLKIDQRIEWWNHYARSKGIDGTIPTKLLSADLEELSAEPLLNFLLVLSGYHKDLEDGRPVNRNYVYKRLLFGVHNRQYETGRFKPTQALSDDDFAQVMETIAVAAWYGDGRTTTVDEIRKKCTTARLRSIFDGFIAGGSSGVSRLIAAFYFQANEDSGLDEAFEFTHKSFGEYLTARRLVRAVDRLARDLSEDQSDSELPFDESRALDVWFDLCGKAPIDPDLARFVRDEFRSDEWSGKQGNWQTQLTRVISHYVSKGITVPAGVQNVKMLSARLANMEGALWCVLNACARSTRTRTVVAWPNSTGLSDCLARAKIGRPIEDQSILRSSLSYLCAVNQDLTIKDLLYADVNHSDFAGSNLTGSIFENADLKGVTLRGASLRFMHVVMSDASFADMNSVTLHKIGSYEAVLYRANLSQAQISDSTFERMNATMCDLQGAEITKVRFVDCSMIDVDWRNSKLSGVAFESCDLKGGNFNGAHLERITFLNSNLSGVTFRNANLASIDVSGSVVGRATFNTEQRAGIDLTKAKSKGRFQRHGPPLPYPAEYEDEGALA